MLELTNNRATRLWWLCLEKSIEFLEKSGLNELMKLQRYVSTRLYFHSEAYISEMYKAIT